MKKTFKIAFLLLFFSISIVSINENKKVEAKATSTQLKRVLKKYTSEPIIEFYYDDFNHDHKYEAFALTGSVSNEPGFGDVCKGSVWFINSKKASHLMYNNPWGKGVQKKFGKKYKFVKKKFIAFHRAYTTASISYAWSVKGSKAKKEKVSGKVYLMNKTKYGWVEGEHSTYDGCYDNGFYIGHTWKPYYFYYKNGVKEYGGKKISKKTLLKKYKSAAKYLKGKKVLEIYYRKNGIININYKKRRDGMTNFYNITLLAKEKKVKKYATNSGRYKKSLIPSIATYPKKF